MSEKHFAFPEPAYDKILSWELYSENLATDYRQALEEGRTVQPYEALIQAIAALPKGRIREQLAENAALLLASAPTRADYAYEEPSDCAGIQKCKRGNPVPADSAEIQRLEDKLRGAWYGRIAGCLLGKPVEGIRRRELEYVLRQTGNYPLARYLREADMTEEIYGACRHNLRGRIFEESAQGAAPPDDDTNYTAMAALKLVEVYGRGFTSEDVGACWIESQPKRAYCTAERVAFINLANGFLPPDSAVYKNPFREWLGAQIRADYFGYINPGDPAAAAEMAWRDASVSHVKNGIYGEMLFAAVIAAAALSDDMPQIIRAGLAEIPSKSRLHESVETLLAMYESGACFDACTAWIYADWDEGSAHDWCHTIPNALIVCAALLFGEKDFGKTICLAVSCGFDTDCNGATAGSVIGMARSFAHIPNAWTDCFAGKLQTHITGWSEVEIESLIALTRKHIREKK